jgi:transmembrane sensor
LVEAGPIGVKGLSGHRGPSRRWGMDELIIRMLSGAASPFEKERLKRWREEAPENEARFRDMARVWELTGPEPPVTVPRTPPVEVIIATARARAAPPRPLALPRRWWLLAASVAALSLGVQLFRPRGPEPMAVYQAAAGQTLTVNLRDGSFARLAEGARLEEWEAGPRRLVSLEGQAFFAVARDSARPFVVRTSTGQVRVLGTRFELRSDPGSLRTVVVEGRVEVSNPEGMVEVGAGEMALAQLGAPPAATTPEDIYALLDWPDGTLVFQSTPLKAVAGEVTRFFGRPLVVTGAAMEGRRITAWFQGESFDEVAEALCQAAGAVCRGEGGGVAMEAPHETGGIS